MEHNGTGTYPTGKRGFHIAHLNLQSINNKFDLLKIHIEQLKFHIFTFSESWLNDNITDNMLCISGFNLVRFDRQWKEGNGNQVKKGGGVGMYIRDDLTYSTEALKEHNVNSGDVECGWIRVIMKNSKDIVIGVVYRPPSGNIEAFCKNMTTSLEEIGVDYGKDIFLLGDFNINYLANDDSNKKQLLNLENLTGLKQLIKQPTRLHNCIDLILTNCFDVADAGVLPIGVSDHDLVFVTRKKEMIKREQVDFYGRSYRRYDREVFGAYLTEHDWADYWDFDNPDQCWDYIIELIGRFLDPLCPIKRRRVRNSGEPWLCNEILEAIYDKDQAWKQAKRTKDAEDLLVAKRLRNQVKDMIRRAKRDFIQEEIDNNELSTRKFWEKLNYVLPTKDKGSSIRLINKDDNGVIDDEDLPSYINRFFTEIGPKLAANFDEEWVDNIPNYDMDMMGNVEVTIPEMEKIVKSINIGKSSAVTNFSSGVLKDAFLVILPQLVHMYNLSFSTGIFPDVWKIANVIPLKKGGDPTDVNNLRPVSLLPLPGKLAERIIHTHIANFIEVRGLLNKNQGGFRKERSTISTTAKFVDDILLGMNDSQYTVATFIDLKKAFDTINHEILIRKLPNFGINDNIVTWIKNYLNNRKQKCTVNGRTSSELDITCGVPQGSILGPLLFLLFINDLDQDLLHSRVLLYADDTVLYATHDQEAFAHLWVAEDLKLLTTWCQKNKLTVNINKTKVMLFGTRNMLKRGIRCDTFINGTKLQYVNHFNYLGVKLDSSLTFELHASESLKMVAHKLYLLARVRKFITPEQAITIYRSKIVPYFDYGDIFLMNITAKTTQKLQKMQNRALRICIQAEGRTNVNT